MADVTTDYTVDQDALEQLLYAEDGEVGTWLTDVVGARMLEEGRARAPHKTGTLEADLSLQIEDGGTPTMGLLVGHTEALFVRAEEPRSYATFQMMGTGQGTGGFIYPKTAKLLRFEIDGRVIFAPRVRGIDANPYLTDALDTVMSSL